MPRKGWIKLHHQLLDNPEWLQTPFDESHAWVDLLLLAESEERKLEMDGGEMTLTPGTVFKSKKELRTRWGWTRYKLDTVLAKWESLGMIKVNQHDFQHSFQHHSYTGVTVVKWAFFQGNRKKISTDFSTDSDIIIKNIYKKGDGDGAKRPRPHASQKSPRGGEVVMVRDEKGDLVAVKK